MKSKPKANPDFEFLDRTSRKLGFLYEDPWRVFRIQSDLIQNVETMASALQDSERVAAVFGSARKSQSDQYCEHAREICRLLGSKGFTIVTGGGPGIMEAANQGTREGGGLCIETVVRWLVDASEGRSHLDGGLAKMFGLSCP